MIDKEDIGLVRIEIARTIKALRELETIGSPFDENHFYTGKYIPSSYTGAVRRASMDLSRALIKLRKG